MRIGELAERVGTSTRTLRYYEARGLLPARRSVNGYRDYDEDDLRLVREIRALLDIGFGLEETRPFVECLRAGHPTGDACPASLEVYRRKLAELDAYLARLGTMRTRLSGQLAAAEALRLPPAPAPRCELTPGDEDGRERTG
ncbi:MerR family transcriptional regulator [Planosporangium sp. 12N6]|uniref:MerR family transcriptional regulator n=1 Tax=Planosporangium spinosum TaxID=3402278 RepID=UPI003CF14471